ncbi:MAG: hypothetical protein EMLJLAPB_01260 [Candidatus Argoarchaeum ethanivorans]|uniref:Uncharacterized protein n=1 Tax=Candidatus Argoarchaeum ethanivorans TaxID=2608793 RepID=A0A811TL30_9EURY|nr:MAG: hypothetical protein EMLJLAPB_01260 [Candidatus Argoarchaeum ethanivorans]
MDAVKGEIIGYGIPPPATGFSVSGPQNVSNCSGVWTELYQNAESWFNTMGYPTEAVVYPNEAKIKSHIQSYETVMFYEIAHSVGGSSAFRNNCTDTTTADEIHNWIKDYPKMPFTFLASCNGTCDMGSGTLSYEFRKGSTDDTVTIGYCGMNETPCNQTCWYDDALDWQDALFNYMNQGWTVKDAFDQACYSYPGCYNETAGIRCVRFAGDENFKVVPKIGRVSLGEAVDNFILSWSTGGDANWFGQTLESYHDGDSAESGDISDGENTWLETTVEGPCDVSFYWKVDSQYEHDYLRFYIDGAEQDKISGSTSWAQKTYSISGGSHTLTWKYTKDSSGSNPGDCSWVDMVSITEDWCAAESAVHQAKISEPDDVLNPLRRMRDDSLKDDYVARYYDYSPDLVKVMAKNPALVYETASLIVKHSTVVEHHVKGIKDEKVITRGDVEELVSFAEKLRIGVLANSEQG